jgi:hypothetical protein
MNADIPESGRERKVQFLGGANLDGAPVAFIIVLAAVVTALSFIPFSVVIGTGGSFPMSHAVLTLNSLILGPIAGLVADLIGVIIGIFVAPYTASVPVLSLITAVVAGFAGGTFVLGKPRSGWWIPVAVLVAVDFVVYAAAAAMNGNSLGIFIAETAINWTGFILYVLPTRGMIARWINSSKPVELAAGMFLSTWIVMGFAHLVASSVAYFMFGWPEATFVTLIPVVPVQHLARALGGMVIGSGVILGLRAIGLVKPKWAIY